MTIEAAVNLITSIRKAIKSRSDIGMFEEAPLSVALGMAIAALEKQEKYKWHDLRKNPEDLPVAEERVVLTLDLVREHRNVYGLRAKNGAWVVNGFETSIEVIAWRTDEPFEEDNE